MTSGDLAIRFDALAGAAYGVFGIARSPLGSNHSPTEGTQQINGPLFAWLLMAESLARYDDPGFAWRWASDQLRMAAWNRSLIHQALQLRIQNHWSSALPILLLAPERQQPFMEAYQQEFGAQQYSSLYKLLLTLWTRYGANLFRPGDWLAEVKQPERYATPALACIVKLGLTLKSLAEQSDSVERNQWEAWQQLLKQGVLHRLPERITRGFAPDAPLFEDLVLVLLTVAEWLTFDQTWRIHTLLGDTDNRPAECLSLEQKILAGALYGWQRGYRRVGNLVTGQRQRAILSRQAIRLAVQSTCVKQLPTDTAGLLVLHSTEHGTLSAFSAPFIQLARYEQYEKAEYDLVTQITNAVKSGGIDLQLAQQSFTVHLDLPA